MVDVFDSEEVSVCVACVEGNLVSDPLLNPFCVDSVEYVVEFSAVKISSSFVSVATDTEFVVPPISSDIVLFSWYSSLTYVDVGSWVELIEVDVTLPDDKVSKCVVKNEVVDSLSCNNVGVVGSRFRKVVASLDKASVIL